MTKNVIEISRTVPVSPAVMSILWEHVIRLSSRTLVEGFSCAKKCSNEGRALMQLDYQQVCSTIRWTMLKNSINSNYL
jgi:hypothetical protein